MLGGAQHDAGEQLGALFSTLDCRERGVSRLELRGRRQIQEIVQVRAHLGLDQSVTNGGVGRLHAFCLRGDGVDLEDVSQQEACRVLAANPAEVEGARAVDAVAAARRRERNALGQRALADPGLSAQQHAASASLTQAAVEQRFQLIELEVSSDKLDAVRRRFGRSLPLQGKGCYRFAETLHRHRRERLRLEARVDESKSGCRHLHAAGFRGLLHARGERDAGAGGVVLLLAGAADLQHDDLTRVQTDARLDPAAVIAFQRVRVLDDVLLQLERCKAGLRCMILEGDRRAEHGHDTVAHETADGATVLLYGLAHPLHGAVQPLVRVFWIERLGQCGRAGNVGKQ